MTSPGISSGLRWQRAFWRGGLSSAAILWTLVTLLPLLWMFVSSFKTQADLTQNRWGLPQHWTSQNYVSVWTGQLRDSANAEATPLSFFVKSSLIVTLSALFATVLLAVPLAYALATVRFRGRGLIISGNLIFLAVPVQTLLIPIWHAETALRITDTYLGLILPFVGTALPFGVLLLTAYFHSFPEDLKDAATMDGLSVLGTLVKVVVPLSKGPIAAISILLANGFWNDFLFALVLMSSPERQTLPVGVVQFTEAGYNQPLNLVLAALSIVTAPILIAYIAFQRYITSAQFQVTK